MNEDRGLQTGAAPLKSIKQCVAEAIEKEREFQDGKWGTYVEHPHTILEWIIIMEQELKEAKDAFFLRPPEGAMLAEIIQVVAVGHACLEQHGPWGFRN